MHPKKELSDRLSVSENCSGCSAMHDGSCKVTPQATEGPFFVAGAPERRNVTEGLAGIPVSLILKFVGQDGTPVTGAKIDIWHVDARGVYSGQRFHDGEEILDTIGEWFMRGYQVSDDQGLVHFDTIYPGWYQGRTTHVHVKVSLDNQAVLNSQIYFPDALNEFIYTTHPDYVRDKVRDTLNALDQFREPTGYKTLCNLKEERDGYLASLRFVVDRQAIAPDFKPITTDKIVSHIPALPRSPELTQEDRRKHLLRG